MRRTLGHILLPVSAAVLLAAGSVGGGSITGSTNRHNLSVTGPGYPGITQSTEEERICIFCHTPHHANTGAGQDAPLWSRDLPLQTYDLYASSTLRATPQQPTGSSRLCLSCHDGTIALGKLAGGTTIGGLTSPMPIGPSNLGEGSLQPDLSNDHPISFVYPVGQDELQDPAALLPDFKLEDGMLQCVSCHDPHDDTFPYFMVVDNRLPTSPLCTGCHQKTGWDTTTHQGIAITFPAVGSLPAEDAAGCTICHKSHSAPQKENLVRGDDGSQTCTLVCHNGTAPREVRGANVLTAITAPFRHPVGEDPGIHRAAEDILHATTEERHVECVDCHNPHRVNPRVAAAPEADGLLEGVRVESYSATDFRLGTTQYDICFKCHAESADVFVPLIENLPLRVYDSRNQRDRFTLANSSFHPVMGKVDPSRVTNLTGLKSYFTRRDGTLVTLDINTILYCSDCHHPHGSGEEHLLRDRYQQNTMPTLYSSYDAALCWRCHEESRLLDGITSSFPQHQSHVSTRAIPCSVCHDPHGLPGDRLINFDTRPGFVSPTSPVPVYNFVEKSCVVSCHTAPGNKEFY